MARHHLKRKLRTNFGRVHQTLRVTPAMESGLSDHVWSIDELCALLPKPTVSASQIEKRLLAEVLAVKSNA